MQEQKTVNQSVLQIAGLLFAKPSIPASAALWLIFYRPRKGPETGLGVSHCPESGQRVTHSLPPV